MLTKQDENNHDTWVRRGRLPVNHTFATLRRAPDDTTKRMFMKLKELERMKMPSKRMSRVLLLISNVVHWSHCIVSVMRRAMVSPELVRFAARWRSTHVAIPGGCTVGG